MIIDPQPETSIPQEGKNKPNEECQRNHDGKNHIFEFITQMHKYLHDISCLKQGE
jgi:hypothetical protein